MAPDEPATSMPDALIGKREALSIDEVTQDMRDAVAASRAPPESRAFNHEIDPE